MASSVIGALRVNLGLDSAKFGKGMSDAQKRLKVARTQFVAVAGAAAAMGAALTTAALAGARDIDRAAKAAKRLDSSIGGFRALELAAGEAGVSLSGMTNDIQTMNRELANIGVTGNADRALDALGLSISDLAGLDTDEKLAVIADQVKALGLDAGQATAILRDLGVRNREMALLVLGGGDAIRKARADIKEYGLEISAVDASRIETANDQIGRLGLITQYAGQQLATTLVPALGAMAKAMTDSLREGGLLRTIIDGLTSNMDRLGTYVAVVVTGFGVRYVGALVLARLATVNLSAALLFLRGALIRTGIFTLIVAAGELVYQFTRLVTATGGWGNALKLLGEVALGVWRGIVTSASAVPVGLNAVWEIVKSGFLLLISDLFDAWSSFLQGVARTIEGIPAFEGVFTALQGSITKVIASSGDYAAAASGASAAASRLKAEAGALAKEGFDEAATAMSKLTAAVNSGAGDMDDGSAAADNFAESLDGVADSASGGGGKGGVVPKLKEIKPELTDLQRGFESFKTSVASAFEGLITGAKSFKEALGDVLSSLASMFAQSAVSGLFENFKLPGFATGTPYAQGGLAMVGERGRELVNLPRGSQVLNANQTRGVMGSGASFNPVFNIDARGADAGAVQRLEAALTRANAEFEDRAVNAFNMGKKRRKII